MDAGVQRKRLIGWIVLVASVFLMSDARAERNHPEAYYQERFCTQRGGQMEVVLPDKTRIDCLTTRHAWEVDFADKWAEGIGQSLYYASQTGKIAGLVIIVEDMDHDLRYLLRIRRLLDYYKVRIDVYLIFDKTTPV